MGWGHCASREIVVVTVWLGQGEGESESNNRFFHATQHLPWHEWGFAKRKQLLKKVCNEKHEQKYYSQEELLLWNETQLKNTSPLTFALMLTVETKHKRVECAKKEKFNQIKNFKKHLE